MFWHGRGVDPKNSIYNTKTFLTFCRNMVIKTERNIVWNDLKYVLAWKRRRSQELHFQHKNLSHILLSAVFGRLHKQAKFPLFQRKTFHTWGSMSFIPHTYHTYTNIYHTMCTWKHLVLFSCKSDIYLSINIPRPGPQGNPWCTRIYFRI